MFSANILHSFDPLKIRLLLRRVYDLKFSIHRLLFLGVFFSIFNSWCMCVMGRGGGLHQLLIFNGGSNSFIKK